MNFHSRSFSRLLLTCSAFGVLSAASAIKPGTPAFDGQYINPNASNVQVEWWWGQAIAEPIGNNPPAAFQFIFYQGQPIAPPGPKDPSLPEFFISINGFFSNGSQFAGTLPASSGTVSTSGQDVAGTWDGAGSFEGSADLRTFTAKFDAPALGFVGTVTLKTNANGAAHHFGCNTTSDPYFSSAVPAGAVLSDAETVLFKQLGWATTLPGAISEVNMLINGTPLKFTGQGYHDANFLPKPLNLVVSTWFFGSATVGEYDLSYVKAQAANSSKVLSTGYLAKNGVVLQNQCSVLGAKNTDVSQVTPYGLEHDAVAGVDAPTGFIIEYILRDGEHYRFNLSSIGGAQNPDQSIYHRWVGGAAGGKVGDEPQHGLTVFEWLNPGLVPYNPWEIQR
ncbi:hypothetical protein GGX14DRAFT_661702 [Mycena pura]|uniref:Uncharacterized protein n=1 Tax=Mycena pura TaxID=153505 RepID=A0AAD6V0P6_9AGAR|nr:hypothetical protein GGX14DRAFT_661702 [Mycena pura]